MKLIIIKLFCLLFLVENKSFSTNYYPLNDGIYILGKIGKKKTYSLFIIDINSDINYISQCLNKSISNSPENVNIETIILKNISFNGSLMIDTLTFSEGKIIIVNNFIFYSIENNLTSLYNKISFSYRSKNENFSFVNILKREGLIDYASMAIGKANLDSEGQIYFGNIPISIKQRYYNTTCKVNKGQNHWSCNIQYIYLGNNIKDGYIITKSYFSSTQNFIIAPNEFYEYIYIRIFKEYFDKQKCHKVNKGENIQIDCDYKIHNEFKNISFAIDNTLLSFHTGQQFDCFLLQCSFFILFTNTQSWIFGNFFYSNMYIQFDYEYSKITFYSEREFYYSNISYYISQYKNNNNNNKTKINIFLFNTIIFIVMLIWIIIVKYIITKV